VARDERPVFDSCWFGVLYFEYKNNLTSCSGD
jgi:hypothetical protein